MGLPWGCSQPSFTGHARDFVTFLITLLLLRLGSAQLRVEGPGHPVTATVGQDVVLPCHLSPQRDARTLDVRWIRKEFSETVHHYRNGEDLYWEQMGAYAGRTELARDGLSAGSLDLRIMGLRPSDDGQYICTVEDADAYAETIVDLEVSGWRGAEMLPEGPGTRYLGFLCDLGPLALCSPALWVLQQLEWFWAEATGTDPRLFLGGYEAGGVRVLCRSAGWYPLPQLLWRDARGQHLPFVSQTHSQDQEGLFEIEGAVIVTGSVEGPLSCVVRNSHLQQERESSLHIAAPFFHNAQPWKVALALVLVLLAVSIGLGVYLFRKQAFAFYSSQKGCKAGEVSFPKENSFGVFPWAYSPLTVHCFSLSFPVQQAAEIEEKAERLEEQAAELAWRRSVLPHNRVKVTLDPDTAHPLLVVSQDNKSVRLESERRQVPDTPERFDYWLCMLGREEFREGRHCWLVEGEQLKDSRWAVGVARASVERKGKINMSPEGGIWAVEYNNDHLKPLISSSTLVSLYPVPTRIWVCLNCTQGQVSFINADNGVKIFTFTAASFNGESIRPWFWVETEGIQLCLRDSTPQTLSPAPGASCPSPDTPASPLLDPAGEAQEGAAVGPGAALCSSLLLEESWDAASRGQAPCSPWALPCTRLLCWGTSPTGTHSC
ncbi:butyrophilin subfamily 1 member A1-like [Anas acuta]|uniref:butyrophilin subfamily 1 member A1-like n=1 Tax=Anas acuta TaxID=28680 RepID=UPI0035C924DD